MRLATVEQHGPLSPSGPADASLRRHGRTFHLASRLLPQRTRNQAARLYAFCRYLDDLADEAQDRTRASGELQRMREDLEHGPPRCLHSAAFLSLAHETDLPIAAALELIDTLNGDLQGRRIASEAELTEYAYGAAGTVGLMMCTLLGASDPRAKAHAVDLGIAMQLTNIARDVGEDADRGRVYLPSDWLGPLAATEILNPDPEQQKTLRQATARCLNLADDYYRRGLKGLGFLPSRCRYSIAVAAQVYRAIGSQVAASGYRSWDRRAVVPVRSRLRIAAAALLRQTWKPSRAGPEPLHRARKSKPSHRARKAAQAPNTSTSPDQGSA